MIPCFIRNTVVTLILGVCVFVDTGYCQGRTYFTLEQEDVFCLYFRLSGHPMGNQDIEDLCFAQGKPLFSAFKPAEMFLNASIQEVRERLLKKMKTYGKDPVFVWRFTASPQRGRSLHWATHPPAEPPHATAFIRSVIPPTGWSRIEETALSTPRLGQGPIQISVQARAQSVDQLPEKRIVAQEELRIPIRFIVLHPLEVQIAQAAPDWKLALRKGSLP